MKLSMYIMIREIQVILIIIFASLQGCSFDGFSGVERIKVIDQDGNPVENAKIKYSEHSYFYIVPIPFMNLGFNRRFEKVVITNSEGEAVLDRRYQITSLDQIEKEGYLETKATTTNVFNDQLGGFERTAVLFSAPNGEPKTIQKESEWTQLKSESPDFFSLKKSTFSEFNKNEEGLVFVESKTYSTLEKRLSLILCNNCTIRFSNYYYPYAPLKGYEKGWGYDPSRFIEKSNEVDGDNVFRIYVKSREGRYMYLELIRRLAGNEIKIRSLYNENSNRLLYSSELKSWLKEKNLNYGAPRDSYLNDIWWAGDRHSFPIMTSDSFEQNYSRMKHLSTIKQDGSGLIQNALFSSFNESELLLGPNSSLELIKKVVSEDPILNNS